MLTETWLKDSVDASSVLGFCCENYDLVRCDRPRKVGGGILSLIKPSFSYDLVFSESVVDSYEILSCDIILGKESLRLIGVYRAPSCPSHNNLQLVNTISDLATQIENCILVGDFNYPDVDWGNMNGGSSSSTEFVDMCLSHGFSQLVVSGTRGDSILDLVLSNRAALVRNVAVKPPIGTSDHSAVEFSVRSNLTHSSARLVREFRKANYSDIIAYLRQTD